MSKLAAKAPPPDQAGRARALHPSNSILVQAPAGSGKTTLLTERFLCLLAEVDDPGRVVAITFSNAAAAEMRNRVLNELGADEPSPLARRALDHARSLGWNLLDQPAQLRISTIDSFCRDLALQQPLLSGLGDGLDIYEHPEELYRRAARQTLEQIDGADPAQRSAIEHLLLWRDNNWQEMENLLVEMLNQRDRWMHGFVLEREPDWDKLRRNLERPFAKSVRQSLASLSSLLDQVPGSRDQALNLARFACEQGAAALFQQLAELADFPSITSAGGNFTSADALEEAHAAHLALADLLLTLDGNFRRQVDKRLGFPADRKREKAQILDLINRLSTIPNLESSLAAVRTLPPLRYTDEDWQIVRACFTLLRHAAGQLRVVFAEAGAVDYTEVAQTALAVLKGPDGQPTDAAISVADGIRHILVDEFQDTSRRQHELLRRLIAAWPEREGRSCFVVGDPMQSIYFFRDADAELFPRVKAAGLEIPGADPLLFHPISLTANFRTAQPLVDDLNRIFEKVFETPDGSGVSFSPAQPARDEQAISTSAVPQELSAPSFRVVSGERVGNHGLEHAPRTSAKFSPHFELHINFAPQLPRGKKSAPDAPSEKDTTHEAQTEEIVALIRGHRERMEAARANGGNYRIAILGRSHNVLAPIAKALREAAIPFRAVDLEKLSARPEVLDALALARALLNPLDRVSWLGVLRAPWCGLSLHDLHILTSADDLALMARPVPELLAERLHLLSQEGRLAAERVLETLSAVPALRFAQPAASLGTWLEQVWLRLGGAECVDPAARINLDLLWQSLDSLPNREQDLLGPALSAALGSLTAQPDPAAGSECGVQLMTIHKSKGLEFEVVIVPELQARSRKGDFKLLSWLERGLPPEDISDRQDTFEEITEFLVAPLQSKGADRGSAKQWVDRVYRDRESQEMRRILYVAATRARDELHLFARPACKKEKDGAWVLAEPKDSLLATAWPALEDEIRRRFVEWRQEACQTEVEGGELRKATLESLAASAESNLLVMPPQSTPTLIRRLPPGYRSARGEHSAAPGEAQTVIGMYDDQLYQRHEGGLLSRALGTAVHALLENLSHLRKTNDWEAARAALKQLQPRIAAQIRAAGVDPSKSAAIADEALRLALNASDEPLGKWILSPHTGDASEVRWTGVVAGSLRTVQVDRVFRAGPEPLSEESLSAAGETWWIVDYKTAHADNPDPATALPRMREIFAPQLEAYAQVLGNLHGNGAPIRAGLYYPRTLLFDWWEI